MTKPFRLPKDIPLEEYPKPDVYLEEARALVEDARAQGIVLRVMGPIALHEYFPKHAELYRRMERLGERVFTDIDFAAYSRSRNRLVPFFEAHGYELERRAAVLSGGARMIFYAGRVPMVDVFFDRLDYNHPVDYRGRLELHPVCVSLADLLLQKLQIVQINDKDLKDAMLLLLAAPLDGPQTTRLDAGYIARLFADDWGFYTTGTANLGRLRQTTEGVGALSAEQRAAIAARAEELLQAIEAAPKTGRWRARAKVGTRKPWYREVADWD